MLISAELSCIRELQTVFRKKRKEHVDHCTKVSFSSLFRTTQTVCTRTTFSALRRKDSKEGTGSILLEKVIRFSNGLFKSLRQSFISMWTVVAEVDSRCFLSELLDELSLCLLLSTNTVRVKGNSSKWV